MDTMSPQSDDNEFQFLDYIEYSQENKSND